MYFSPAEYEGRIIIWPIQSLRLQILKPGQTGPERVQQVGVGIGSLFTRQDSSLDGVDPEVRLKRLPAEQRFILPDFCDQE